MADTQTSSHRLRDLIRRRREHTGETHVQALTEIRAHGLLPGPGNRWQELLESWFLTSLNDWERVQYPDWHWPAATVLGLTAVTPRPHELVLHVHPDALLILLNAVLPTAVPDSRDDIGNLSAPLAYAGGVPGLRTAHSRRGLTLFWPGCGARILITGLRRDTWIDLDQQLRTMCEDEDPLPPPLTDHGPDPELPLWDHEHWLAAEKSWLITDPQQPGEARTTWADSALLRRAGLFRTMTPRYLQCQSDSLRRSVDTVDIHVGSPTAATTVAVARAAPGPSDTPWPLQHGERPALHESWTAEQRREVDDLNHMSVPEIEATTILDRLPDTPWSPGA